jgi:hypothetical protein
MPATKAELVTVLRARTPRARDETDPADDEVLSPAAHAALLRVDLRHEPHESGHRTGERARRDIRAALEAAYPGRVFVSPQIFHAYQALVRGRDREG